MARSWAPSLFQSCLGPLGPFDGALSRPFGRQEKAHLSFPEEGAPSGLPAVQRSRVTLNRNVKGDFGNPLLPPTRATVSRPRRLQVDKSPVGAGGTAAKAPRAAPCPRNSSQRETSPPGPSLLPGIQGLSHGAGAGASLAPPRAHWHPRWPRPALSPFGT